MKIHFKERFIIPAEGGSEIDIGDRTREIKFPCPPPKGSIFTFSDGTKLHIPDGDRTKIRVNSIRTPMGRIKGEVFYDIERTDFRGSSYATVKEELQAEAEECTQWDYNLRGS